MQLNDNDETVSISVTTNIKKEITEEPTQSFSGEEASLSGGDSNQKRQSLKIALEDDSIPQVSSKRIKIEPIASGVPFVMELISRSSQ